MVTDEERERILAESRELIERRPQSYTPPPDDALHFRTHDPADHEPEPELRAPTPQPERDWSGWEEWLQARISAALEAERSTLCQIMAHVIAASERKTRKTTQRELDRQMSGLRAEVASARQSFEALRETIVAERAKVASAAVAQQRYELMMQTREQRTEMLIAMRVAELRRLAQRTTETYDKLFQRRLTPDERARLIDRLKRDLKNTRRSS